MFAVAEVHLKRTRADEALLQPIFALLLVVCESEALELRGVGPGGVGLGDVGGGDADAGVFGEVDAVGEGDGGFDDAVVGYCPSSSASRVFKYMDVYDLLMSGGLRRWDSFRKLSMSGRFARSFF